MEYVHAFWVGGLICAAVQILMDRTKLMPGRIMVLLVCGGAVLGFLNIYGPFQKFAGAGASVPLLGFGNVLWNGVKEAVEKMFDGTKVAKVNTMNCEGKNKRRGMVTGKTAKTKKAIVQLTADSKDIEIFAGL